MSAREIGGVRVTGRERQILFHVLALESYKAIGATLGISERTVEAHVRNLARKIDDASTVPTYKRVLAWAIEHVGPPLPPGLPAG